MSHNYNVHFLLLFYHSVKFFLDYYNNQLVKHHDVHKQAHAHQLSKIYPVKYTKY